MICVTRAHPVFAKSPLQMVAERKIRGKTARIIGDRQVFLRQAGAASRQAQLDRQVFAEQATVGKVQAESVMAITQAGATQVGAIHVGHDVQGVLFIVDEYVDRKGNVRMREIKRPTPELSVSHAFQHRLQPRLHAVRDGRGYLPDIALQACRYRHTTACAGIAKLKARQCPVAVLGNGKAEPGLLRIARLHQVCSVQTRQDARDRPAVPQQPEGSRLPRFAIGSAFDCPTRQLRAIFSIDAAFADRLVRQGHRLDPRADVDRSRDAG